VSRVGDTAVIESSLGDGLDIPTFLKISRERRSAASAEYDAQRNANNNDHSTAEDRGSGAVCRRLGIPDGINQEFVAAIKGREEAARLAKREEGLARLAEWKARARAEKAEMNAIRSRALAQHRKG
jgi:hypothetical protein